MEKHTLSLRDRRLLEIPYPLSEYLTEERFADDQIVSLDFGNNLIRILNNLESFVRLRELNLEKNKIHSIFVRGIHLSLKLLNLSFNELRRCNIGISEFPHLTELHLDDNLLTHIEDFDTFPKTLKLLTANNNQLHIKRSSSNMLQFPNLKELQLSGNNIGNIGVFRELHAVEKLNLASNSICNIEALSALSKHLTYLNLSRNFITSISPLSSLISLRILLLHENSIAASVEVIVSRLNSLSSLEKIDLRFNPATCIFYTHKRLEESEQIFRNMEEFNKVHPFLNGLDSKQERARYRDLLASHLPKLELIDNIIVSEDERQGKSIEKLFSKKFSEELHQSNVEEEQLPNEEDFQTYLNSTADEIEEENIEKHAELDKELLDDGRQIKVDPVSETPKNYLIRVDNKRQFVDEAIQTFGEKSPYNDNTLEYALEPHVDIVSTPIQQDGSMRFEIQLNETQKIQEESFFDELKSQSERLSLIQKDIESIKIDMKSSPNIGTTLSDSSSKVNLTSSQNKGKLPNPLEVIPQASLLPSPQLLVNPFTNSPIIRDYPTNTSSSSSFLDSNSLPNITDTPSPSFVKTRLLPSVSDLLVSEEKKSIHEEIEDEKLEENEEIHEEKEEATSKILPSVEIESESPPNELEEKDDKKSHSFWVNMEGNSEDMKKKEILRQKKLEKLNERKSNVQFKWKEKKNFQKGSEEISKKKDETPKVEVKPVPPKQAPKPVINMPVVVNHRKLAEDQIKNQPLMRNKESPNIVRTPAEKSIPPKKENVNKKPNQRTELIPKETARFPKGKNQVMSKSVERSQAPKVFVQRAAESLPNKTNEPKTQKKSSLTDSDEEFGIKKGSKLSPAVLERKLKNFNIKPVESREIIEEIEEELASEPPVRVEKHKRKENNSSSYKSSSLPVRADSLDEKINKKLFSDILLLKLLLCKWSRIPPSAAILPPLENETVVKDLIAEHPEFTACANLLKLENSTFEVRHVIKLYNHGFHQNINALDNFVNHDGTNVLLLFHCASPQILSRVSREGFGMYRTAGELLVATSAVASEAYAKEFLPWKESEEERRNPRVHRVLLSLAKISHTLSWSEAENLQNLSPDDCVIFPISPSFESQGKKDYVYIFSSPDRLVPCYLVEYIEM